MGRQVWRPGNMLYPLPVVMVSCALKGERPNIITVAWTGTICSDPPMVSISVRKSRYSHHIIKLSGEFVINLTNEKLARAADYCGVKSGKDTDKFKECALTELKSEKVSPPGIKESPVCIECRVKEIRELGSHDMFIAEVVSVSVDDEYMNKNGKFELADAKPVVYSHGEYYMLGKRLGSFGFSVKKRKKHESIHN